MKARRLSGVSALWGASCLFLVARDLSPSLEVLPLNSTLSNVTIPRFDENNKRVGYLKAELMEILADGEPVGDRQPIMVDCSGIQLRMPSSDSTWGTIHVDMEKARYRITPGVLTVQEKIVTYSPRFTVDGVGGVFHLDTQRGFIFGPVDCLIFPENTKEAHLMNRPATALLASTSLILAEPTYQPPTEAELLEVEKAALPQRSRLTEQQAKTKRSLAEKERVAQAADERLQAFTSDVQSDSLRLLIQNPPQPGEKGLLKRARLTDADLRINCDGGCFFDGDENLLVLLRNVVVKENRFTLKAKKEIKVFFLSETEAPGGKTPPNKGDKAQLDMSIAGVKNLVATGGVNFSGIDEDGNPVEASAATAYYDDSRKTLILKGGRPSFWFKQDKLEIQKMAENEGASLRIKFTEQGTVNVNTSGDGWEILLKNPPFKQD